MPVWYGLANGLVDLEKLVKIELYCPANQRFMPKRTDGNETALIMGYTPTLDRYNNSEVYLFSGTWAEANAELARIRELLIGDDRAADPS